MLIEQAQENARIQEEALRIAESRFRNGATSELDVDPGDDAAREHAGHRSRSCRPALQQARNALSTLLGQPTGTVDALLGGPKEIPTAPAKVAVGVPAEMLRRRPDIRSAELTAAAQCARIGVAKAELYPSFSLLGIDRPAAPSTRDRASHNLFSTEQPLLFRRPAASTGRSSTTAGSTNSVRVEDARFQQLLVGYRDTVLKAAQEVEDALAGFLNAQEAMVFEQNAVTAAQRSVELALVQYREGAADYQRVLDAQRSLLQQQNSLAQTTLVRRRRT